MKPAYFDFTVKDLNKAKTFFEHVFSWRFEKFPMPATTTESKQEPKTNLGLRVELAPLQIHQPLKATL